MVVLVTSKNETIHSKMNALEWSQHFSDYKSMGIFPDAQGQLASQTDVWSGRISNQSETLWLSLSPAWMRKVQSKLKALERSQHYHWFWGGSGAAKSKVGDGILLKFKLVQYFIIVLFTCKNEDASKMTAVEWSQHFFHYKFTGIFQDAQGQLTPKSLVGSCRFLNPSEML